MKVEIQIDSSCVEPRVIVMTNKMTEEVNDLVKRLSVSTPQVIVGFQEEKAQILEPSKIYRVFAANGKVYADTEEGEFLLKLRLYEIEERFDSNNFVRISNSEIMNLQKVKGFDLSFSGTICVNFTNNSVTYVSRRYVTKIRKVLGI